MAGVKARTARRLVVLGATAACVTAALAPQACVIAQPSGDIPRLPDSRPTIVHPSVVPSTSRVLTHFPSVFIVPVELVDPTAPFQYAAFIDYSPRGTGEGLVLGPIPSSFEPANTTNRTRRLEIAIPEPTLDSCHVIEVVVALQLNELTPAFAHTPQEPGGDIVTWFYNPTGDPGGCPSLDAGIDAPADAADADAREGGTQ